MRSSSSSRSARLGPVLLPSCMVRTITNRRFTAPIVESICSMNNEHVEHSNQHLVAYAPGVETGLVVFPGKILYDDIRTFTLYFHFNIGQRRLLIQQAFCLHEVHNTGRDSAISGASSGTVVSSGFGTLVTSGVWRRRGRLARRSFLGFHGKMVGMGIYFSK